jgi:hypothetical protein
MKKLIDKFLDMSHPPEWWEIVLVFLFVIIIVVIISICTAPKNDPSEPWFLEK